MQLLQIIGIVFGAFAFSRLILRRRDRTVTLGETLFWSVVWLGLIAVSVAPSILNQAKISGITRAIDILVYLGIIALFYVNFRLYVKVEKQGQDITRLVRQIALQEKKEKK